MHENERRITQFTDKYEEANTITQKLIDGFFATIKSLCPKDAKKVIEVGCGAGYSTRILNEHLKPEIFHASDIDPKLVELMKEKNPTVTGATESIYELPHADNSFDLVFTLEVLEHLENPEKAVAELSRVTSKYAIMSVPNEPLWRILNCARGKYWKDLGNTPGHINHWSPKTFRALLNTSFNVKEVRTSLPWIIALVEKK